MRLVRGMMAWLLAVLWLPGTLHCAMEQAGWWESGAEHCCAGEQEHPDDGEAHACKGDVCGLVETGFTKQSTNGAKALPPELVFCLWSAVTPRVAADEEARSLLPTPGEAARRALPNTWQFVYRAALEPRAPGLTV